MDTRTQTSSIYREEIAHLQALASATCKFRSTALFGVLDQGFYTCCDGFSTTQGPTMPSGCFGVTRSGPIQRLAPRRRADATKQRGARLRRLARRLARCGRGVIYQQAVLSN